jgi:hypothetical protein
MGAKSTIRNATKTVAEIFSPEKPAEETDVLDTLKREHDEVKALLEDLQSAETASERQRLVESIKAALVPHTHAEEKVVYDAVIATAYDDAETDGQEGYLEHEWASKTLERLEAAQPTSSEHKAAAKVLKELVEHHVKEEERNIWRDLREHFSDEERMRMNVDFGAAKRQVKLS